MYIEVVCSDRIGRKVRVKCLKEDTVYELKQVLGLQMQTDPDKIVLKRGATVLKDLITLEDYEVRNQSMLEIFYS
ncbi:ubiquitin-like protein [Starmerella bacillaris]|uniref:Ubiquitin-like modifier HUB1 n=1 Tax=Starmerella bacillaris TaxID=1247836 RepID=A0AAV5RL91_STABA|nr:ubiquitin-like protein [Starmerella bacillaris]